MFAIKNQPTDRESPGCLTALFVVAFLPLIGYLFFTLGWDNDMDGGVMVIGGVIALAGINVLARRTPLRMEIRSDRNHSDYQKILQANIVLPIVRFEVRNQPLDANRISNNAMIPAPLSQ